MASLFNPMGLLSPCLIAAKQCFTKACKGKWNDSLSEQTKVQWEEIRSGWKEIENIFIQRFIKVKERHLFGFCNASPVTYGCAFYISSKDINGRFLCFSKSQINNNPNHSILQLEFAAAVLMPKYLPLVLDAHNIPCHPTHVWLYSDVQ
jgi:Pao retrotransposon peptidase